MADSKKELRSSFLLTRRRLSSAQLRTYDASFARHAVDLVGKQVACSVAAYVGLPGEPGGHQLVTQLSAISTVWLPICLDDAHLAWSVFTGWEDMVPGAYGILEPTGHRHSRPECDLMFLPALGVSPRGVRLGKGGGYYDRFLAHSHTPTAALTYSWEVREDIPQEAHDRCVDAILTESGVLAITGF